MDALQGPLHGHGEPGVHPRGGRGGQAGALRHRRRARGRGARGPRPRGQRARRPAARLPDLPHPDRGDPLPRARGLEGALPRARRASSTTPTAAAPSPWWRPRWPWPTAPTWWRSTSRSTAARRASTTSRRSTPRTSTGWSSCCARPSARPGDGPAAESEGAKRYHRMMARSIVAGKLIPRGEVLTARDAGLQAHGRALRARASRRARPTA